MGYRSRCLRNVRWTFGLPVVLVLLAGCGKPAAKKKLGLPPLMIWAWDRPEDLRFLRATTTGVAYLAGTLDILRDGVIRAEMRGVPVQVPVRTTLLPAIRIQSVRGHAPANVNAIVSVLIQAAQVDGGEQLQIDFDARQSEQALYRDVLDRLEGKRVSVTALVSWCSSDSWLGGARVSEVVPMLFRMGHKVSADQIRLESPECGGSVGLSTDEPWPVHRPPGLQRIYLFNPHAWTAEEYRLACRRVEEWR